MVAHERDMMQTREITLNSCRCCHSGVLVVEDGLHDCHLHLVCAPSMQMRASHVVTSQSCFAKSMLAFFLNYFYKFALHSTNRVKCAHLFTNQLSFCYQEFEITAIDFTTGGQVGATLVLQ